MTVPDIERLIARRDYLRRNLPIWEASGMTRLAAGKPADWDKRLEFWKNRELEYRGLAYWLNQLGYPEPATLEVEDAVHARATG